jgi:methane monooxygenase component A beta chain/propane monooxygenase small subunit
VTATTDAATTAREGLEGDRTFTWIRTAKRTPSEYELLTVGLQSSPEEWLHVGWPVRFEDGSPPWGDDVSRVRTSLLSDYRDPSELWQRPYVANTNHQQQALDRLVPVCTASAATAVTAQWRSEILERPYAAWPFVEYGLFLALAYVVRQCRADTVEFMVAFQVFDRLRLQQDIVQHLYQLELDVPGFSDTHARDAWMSDPALIPVREVVEHIIAGNDWFETVVAINLAFEPLVGQLAKLGLFASFAPINGDSATPIVLAQSKLDAERAATSVQELIRLAAGDPDHGAANSEIISEWVTKWSAQCRAAAEGLATLFPTAGLADAARAAAAQAQSEVVSGAGLVLA